MFSQQKSQERNEPKKTISINSEFKKIKCDLIRNPYIMK